MIKRIAIYIIFTVIFFAFSSIVLQNPVARADPAATPTPAATPAPTGATPAAGTAPAPAVTPAPTTGVSVGVPIPGSGKTSYTQWNQYLSDFFKFAETVGVSLGVLMIVWAGYLYMFSAGDSTKLNSAKEYLLGAVIGLALLYLINYISLLLGICNINGKAC